MSLVRFYRNLGFVLWIIAVIAFGAFLLKKLNVEYMLIINTSVIIIEMILLLLMLRNILKNRTVTNILSSKVLIPKGRFSDVQIIADTYIFKESIISTNPTRRSVFRIYIELADKIIEPLELSIVRMFEREVSEQKLDATHCFKEGTHILHLNVSPREKLNFKFNKDINAKVFSVEELYIP